MLYPIKWECSDIGLPPGDPVQLANDFSGTGLQIGLFLGDKF